jgi:hypothetical protein
MERILMDRDDISRFLVKGQFFRAETVKGTKTYLVFLGQLEDGMFAFAHAGRDPRTDRAKVTKYGIHETYRAIEAGDLEPIDRKDVDPEKIGLLVMGLTGLAKRMGVQEYIDRRVSGDLPPESQ